MPGKLRAVAPACNPSIGRKRQGTCLPSRPAYASQRNTVSNLNISKPNPLSKSIGWPSNWQYEMKSWGCLYLQSLSKDFSGTEYTGEKQNKKAWLRDVPPRLYSQRKLQS